MTSRKKKMELLIYSVTLQLLLSPAISGGRYRELLPRHALTSTLYVTSEYMNWTSADPSLANKVPLEGDFPNTCKQYNTTAICSYLNLTSVPDYLNSNITFLDLRHNKIQILGNALTKYFNLEWLNIKHNRICALSDDNFSNLTKLLYLNLQENCLSMDNGFPPLVFQYLTSLLTLKINHNKNVSRSDLEYPDKALSVLHNLTDLHMDGLLNKSLGRGFRNMKLLTHLTLSGPPSGECTHVVVKNETFHNLATLEFLNLTECCLDGRHMESGAFLPLKRLKSLDISRNEQGCLEDLFPVLQGLQQSNVMYLGMADVINPYTPGITVSKKFVEILPSSLTTLVARSNSFETIEGENLESLPKTLVNLDIGDNRFTFGAYLKNLTKLENLKVLNLNGGTLTFDLPMYYPENNRKCENSHAPACKVTHAPQLTDNKVLLTLPRNLENVSIEFAGWSYSLTNFTIDPNNSLTRLSLSGNNIKNLKGPVTGLANLKDLDLVQCNIYSISEYFFDYFPSLVRLNLSSNYFGTISLNAGGKPRFKNLTNLTHLDLSFVNILVISSRAFEGLVSLEKLWLNNNAFYYFDVRISHMINLNFIDFRFTELAKLNASTMDDLNNIYEKNKQLSIDFTETPIRCYCANLFFIEGVIRYEIFSKKLTRYKCVFLDTSERYMPTFDAVYHELKKQCSPETELFAAILGGVIFVLIVIAASIGYRYRWKLRYIYYSAYVNFKSKKDQTDTRDEFMYDVFLSYVSDDQNFVLNNLAPELKTRGLKVHIHAFDFVAGEYIASNILTAIQSSRHTLVVLTSHLLKSVWCKFELQMANMETVHTGRSVLVFLLMENLTKKEMGTELLYHIQNNTYVRFPEVDHRQNQQLMNVFWTKLAADLRS